MEFRKATLADAELYFKWANDELVRENSYEQALFSYETHLAWFNQKLQSPDCFFYLFTLENQTVGQVRIEIKTDETVIGVSIDSKYRGRGLGSTMLEMACNEHFKKFPKACIYAYIKQTNIASYAIFKKAGFKNDQSVMVNKTKSVKLCKTNNYEF